MSSTEKQLADYIDRLNAEQKPEEHEFSSAAPELEGLMETVRRVRTLKEPALPDAGYPKQVAQAVAGRLAPKATGKSRRRSWLAGIAAAAALVILAGLLNFSGPFGGTSLVYAMEKAFHDVQAYHGFMEIVETNAEGKATIQAKLEVWADKQGQYYVKELGGAQTGLITVNNGQKKWQVRPDQKLVYLFPAFPDPHRFTFELGQEIENVQNALETKVLGEETIAGRTTSVLEVTPRGGVPYRLWIDRETKLPLQRVSGMQNALQYRVTYTKLDFSEVVPAKLMAYSLPNGFKKIDTNPEQLVNNLEEAESLAGFTLEVPANIPAGYARESIVVATAGKTVKLSFIGEDQQSRVLILQRQAAGEFKPAATAVLGKVNNSVAEIQSPVQGEQGILAGGGAYAGMTGISSIRWQEDGLEYAVVGDVSLDELAAFVQGLTPGGVQFPTAVAKPANKPQAAVPVDLKAEENEQKSVDAGHSPWKLDPVFVAQVFVSLKMSPEGIQGEYPVKYAELKVAQNTGKAAIIEVGGNQAPIKKVYLQRLIRADSTGIWTVVGYDPKN